MRATRCRICDHPTPPRPWWHRWLVGRTSCEDVVACYARWRAQDRARRAARRA